MNRRRYGHWRIRHWRVAVRTAGAVPAEGWEVGRRVRFAWGIAVVGQETASGSAEVVVWEGASPLSSGWAVYLACPQDVQRYGFELLTIATMTQTGVQRKMITRPWTK